MGIFLISDGIASITKKQWIEAGLSSISFKTAIQRHGMKILEKHRADNTRIDANTVPEPYREIIEARYGKVPTVEYINTVRHIMVDEKNDNAYIYYTEYKKLDGEPLDQETANRLSIKAQLFEAIIAARKKIFKNGQTDDNVWKHIHAWYTEQTEDVKNFTGYKNPKSLKRAVVKFAKEGYISLIHSNSLNDNARKISDRAERLLVSLWAKSDKPFIDEVHRTYMEFINGKKDIVDKTTGEVFSPADFKYVSSSGAVKPMEICRTTVWNYLNKPENIARAKIKRDGNFNYVNSFMPKHRRSRGIYSLSKITMDDVAISRKSDRGWVYKYVATDTVSGFMFRPVYIAGKPNKETVTQLHRNIFSFLRNNSLPDPFEADVEHHLIKDLDFMNMLYRRVTFNKSATSKRQEHFNRQFKYGISHRNGHTRNRWFGRGAYAGIRNIEKGDVVEPVYPLETIVKDDLNDIETWNNSLHPLQKTYPGMTRRDVFFNCINPNLRRMRDCDLAKLIGVWRDATIYSNSVVKAENRDYVISDTDRLQKLKPNTGTVRIFYIPDESGYSEKVYLYQDEKYICDAVDGSLDRYSENRAEWTEADEQNYLNQNKYVSHFNRVVRDGAKELYSVETVSEDKKREIECYLDMLEKSGVKWREENKNRPKTDKTAGETVKNADFGELGRESL